MFDEVDHGNTMILGHAGTRQPDALKPSQKGLQNSSIVYIKWYIPTCNHNHINESMVYTPGGGCLPAVRTQNLVSSA